jgi:hypothetical protein
MLRMFCVSAFIQAGGIPAAPTGSDLFVNLHAEGVQGHT